MHLSEEESDFIQPTAAHANEYVEQLALDTGSRHHIFYKVCRDGCYYFLKSLRPEYLHQTFYREVLRKEYELGAMLQSDYIVGYHQLTDTDDECNVLMDYVNGTTLTDLLSDQPDYFRQPDHLRKFVRQLCLALHEMHSHQALHLDLKPSNIMLTHVNYDVRLIDLGCSYTDARPYLTGQTEGFAAPEQLDAAYDVDARTDIYALGRILQTILLESDGLQSKAIEQIARRCTMEHKADRFQSVNELLAALEKKTSAKTRGVIIGGIALPLIICAIATLFYWQRPSAIADGTVFVDITHDDTLYLQVLSTANHSLTLMPAPASGHQYQGDIVMPDSVIFQDETFFIREISENALRNCSLVTNVHFPPTLTTIGKGAMRNCVSLSALHLPPSLSSLLYEPFAGCASLSYVNWPATATEVPRNCFVGCSSLRRIDLPEGVTTIHQDAFTGCESLEEVLLPSTLQRIDRGAFYACRSLHRITLPANIKVLGEYLFYDCSSLEEISLLATVPPAISTIVDASFQGIVRVPASSLEAYRRAPGWNRLNLQPLD